MLYLEDLIENQLRLDDRQLEEFRELYNNIGSEEDLRYVNNKANQHIVDRIDSGFNYSMKDISKKIKRICDNE